MVPAKGIVGLRHDEALCSALLGGSFNPTALEVTVSGPEVVMSTRTFPLDPDYVGELRKACE